MRQPQRQPAPLQRPAVTSPLALQPEHHPAGAPQRAPSRLLLPLPSLYSHHLAAEIHRCFCLCRALLPACRRLASPPSWRPPSALPWTTAAATAAWSPCRSVTWSAAGASPLVAWYVWCGVCLDSLPPTCNAHLQHCLRYVLIWPNLRPTHLLLPPPLPLLLSCPQENANRLKAYNANLVVFPRRAGKPKAGDAAPAELQTAAQLKGKLMPGAKAAAVVEKIKVTAEMKVGGWVGRVVTVDGSGGRWAVGVWATHFPLLHGHCCCIGLACGCPAGLPAGRACCKHNAAGCSYMAASPRACPHTCLCPQAESAYGTLRLERMNKRMMGVRTKRAAEAAAAEKDA